jgi:prepilin-type N-terminal cleavage/methylation domain-containing protein
MRQQHADSGFTLIEVLLALVILGIAVVAFVAGLASAVRESDIHRKLATVQTILKNASESIRKAADSCSGSLAPSYVAPSGYTWTPAPTLVACPTPGTTRQVTITAQSSDGRASDSVTIIVRAT